MTATENLNDMTRADLNTYATSVGVQNPESYGTKAELIDAINQANGGSDPSAQMSGDGSGQTGESQQPSEAALAEAEAEQGVEMTTLNAPAPAPESHSPNFALSEDATISGPTEQVLTEGAEAAEGWEVSTTVAGDPPGDDQPA